MGIGASTSPPSATLQVEPLAGPAMLERPGPARGPARTGGIRLFILRRILQGLLVLVLVSIVVFAATQALPGDPARAILRRGATPASLAALRDQLHLNQPKVVQYLTWAGGLLHGDAGRSFAAQEPVSKLLGDRIVNTAFLLLVSGVIPFRCRSSSGPTRRSGETGHSMSSPRSPPSCSPHCRSSSSGWRWWSSLPPPSSTSCRRSR